MPKEKIFGNRSAIEHMKKRSLPHFFFNHTILNGKKHKQKRIRLNSQIIKSGIYLHGEQNTKLEKNLLKWLGGNGYITTLASGHDAIQLSIQALGLIPKDEVIFPVNVYPTAFPIALADVTPVPVDVDSNGQMTLKLLKEKITKKTKAVVLVHLYGNTGNIVEIVEFLKKKNIILIEDCAQAFGTFFVGKPVGIFGDIACFSFYPTKNLATLGDGGAVWTRHAKIMEYILAAKSYGERERYKSQFLSGHSRLPEYQAGVLNLYFESIERDFTRRKKVQEHYLKKLSELRILDLVRPLASHADSDPVPHVFVVDVKNRDEFQAFLKKNGVQTLIHYPYPVHLVPAFSFLGLTRGSFPIAEKLSRHIVSLPFHQGITKNVIAYITQTMRSFFYPKPTKRYAVKTRTLPRDTRKTSTPL